MALRYDYDIHRVAALDPDGDRQPGEESAGERTYLALFRDPETAAALREADPVLRGYFEASGFGLTTYDSGAPDGRFPVDDLATRNDVTERLAQNLASFDIDGKDAGAFRFADFFDYEIRAEPIDMAEIIAAPGLEADDVEPPAAARGFLAHVLGGGLPRIAGLSPLTLGVVLLVLVLAPFLTGGFGPS